ncbi:MULTISPECIES: DUF3500 domain-containing protein [unclassified Streptomyces]|uniref:DUF3500 domain-containing protein n=1 Tax=unclassified Streptomyces TaxID=2593676 RepID=UPI00068F292A|nr:MULTISPECIES: DUF3500 domain-containing protein [unclassified Streptomyces]
MTTPGTTRRSRRHRRLAVSGTIVLALGLPACTAPEDDTSMSPRPVTPAGAPATTHTGTAAPAAAFDYAELLRLAEAFRDSLNEEQRADLQQDYTFENASRWHTYPQWYLGERGRLGVDLRTLSDGQWDALNALLAAATGTGTSNGYEQIQQHLIADDYLNSIGAGDGYGRGDFRVAFLGTPSETGRWQLQFGGHHLAVNNTYENGAVAGVTPSFRGMEPPEFTYRGVDYRPEGHEWDTFVALLGSLSDDQLGTARLDETFRDLRLAPGTDWDFPDTPRGVPVSSLDEQQRPLVIEAIENYVRDVDDATAQTYLDRYISQLGDTYVSYSGDPGLTHAGDYIRIDGPTLWLELVMDTPYTSDGPHPHAVWRDKNDDYGGTRR